MGIHRQKEDFRKKNVSCTFPGYITEFDGLLRNVSDHIYIPALIITGKNKPRISLVKFVVSITSVISSKKGNYF